MELALQSGGNENAGRLGFGKPLEFKVVDIGKIETALVCIATNFAGRTGNTGFRFDPAHMRPVQAGGPLIAIFARAIGTVAPEFGM